MESRSFSISSPGLVSVLRDIRTMQRWEILRRAQRGYTMARLAEESHSSLEATQDSLDRLEAVGLVVRRRASSRSGRVAYRAPMERLIIVFDRASEMDRTLMRSMEGGMREYSRSVIDGAEPMYRTSPQGSIAIHGVTSVLLLEEDACAVRDAFRGAYALLVEAERRARESTASAQARGYHVTMEMRELNEPERPMAEIFMVEQSIADENRLVLCRAASMLLSPRELLVAKALGGGRSRPQIARDLGLSAHTIVTMSKRIYRKLGVHSRAELSTRLTAA
jgi:DNA-binding CsgD family transcriptional regulator/predicted transcriptional regulator